VALGAAEHRRKSGDALRVHEGGVGGGQLLGKDDGALGQHGEGFERRLGQVADQPLADHPDIVEPGREIGIAHAGEALADPGDLGLDRPFGVAPLLGDALIDAAHQARVREHGEMRIEQVAHLLGGGFRQGLRLGLELAQLLHRGRDGGGKARVLGLALVGRDMILGNRGIEMVADMRRPDGDAGRDG